MGARGRVGVAEGGGGGGEGVGEAGPVIKRFAGLPDAATAKTV